MRMSMMNVHYVNACLFAVVFLLPCCRDANLQEGKKGSGKKGQRDVPVRVEPVVRGDISLSASFVGELRASESIEVSSKIPGRIEKIQAQMGDKVDKGYLLVVISDDEVRAQIEEARASISVFDASVKKADAEYRNSEAQLERKEKLAAGNLVTPQELDNARTAHATGAASLEVARSQLIQARARAKLLKAQLADCRLAAPFPGYIESRYLDPGAVVSPGTPILKLVSKEPILARFQVEERLVGEMRTRMMSEQVQVKVSVGAYPGETFEGRVIRFSPGLETGSRTAAVEAEIQNEDGRLMTGMYCRVKVDLGTRGGVLLVPLRALVENLGQNVEGGEVPETRIYKLDRERAKLVKVIIGWTQGEVGEVIEGLEEGEMVVVEGQGMLKDGARVRVVGAAAQAGP